MAEKLPPKAARLNEVFLKLKAAGKVKDKKEFAASLDSGYAHMASVFTGRRELTEKLASTLERVYGISKPWLMLGVGKREKPKPPAPADPEIMIMLRQMAEDIATIKNSLKI